MLLGSWLPPRIDINAPVSIANPGKIDQRIRHGLLEYLYLQKV